jgi:hypothetical protein
MWTPEHQKAAERGCCLRYHPAFLTVSGDACGSVRATTNEISLSCCCQAGSQLPRDSRRHN